MRIDPLCKGIVLGNGPSAFKLTAILAGSVQFEVERILEVRKLCRADRIFRQTRGNDDNPVALCEDEIAWKHDGATDADWAAV